VTFPRFLQNSTVNVSNWRQHQAYLYAADVERCHLVVLLPHLSTEQLPKHISSLIAMSHVNHPSIPLHSDLTKRSSVARPPCRRIHFPLLQPKQGRRKLSLLSTKDNPIGLETVMSGLAQSGWSGWAFCCQSCSGHFWPQAVDARSKWLSALAT
jgi:hypothetical protein